MKSTLEKFGLEKGWVKKEEDEPFPFDNNAIVNIFDRIIDESENSSDEDEEEPDEFAKID